MGCSCTPGSQVPTTTAASEVREVGVGTALRIDAMFDGADTIFVRVVETLRCRNARFAVAPVNRSRRAASMWVGDEHEQLLLKGTTDGIELLRYQTYRAALVRDRADNSRCRALLRRGDRRRLSEGPRHRRGCQTGESSCHLRAMPNRHAVAVRVDISGDREVELDGITDAYGRKIARGCYDASPAGQGQRACHARENAGARTDCEDACGGRVEAMRCVSGARACRELAQQDAAFGLGFRDADLAVCAQGFVDCLAAEGVESAKLEQCVTTCQQAQVESRCKS